MEGGVRVQTNRSMLHTRRERGGARPAHLQLCAEQSKSKSKAEPLVSAGARDWGVLDGRLAFREGKSRLDFPTADSRSGVRGWFTKRPAGRAGRACEKRKKGSGTHRGARFSCFRVFLLLLLFVPDFVLFPEVSYTPLYLNMYAQCSRHTLCVCPLDPGSVGNRPCVPNQVIHSQYSRCT